MTVLPLMIFNRLKWADEPPRTVGDVMEMYARHQLGEINGLGPHRILQIAQALLQAGLDPAIHRAASPG
jgi:hypothetical protein